VIDHLGIAVKNHAASKAFYLKALGPLGYGVVMEVTPEQGAPYLGTGLGKSGKPDFWISEGSLGGRIHLCFVADQRSQVDAFYHAAVAAGAKDNGPPGIREHYHPNYYGAFVIDLNGINLEAVCHKPE
jgi:catechol 2,3-dioxygenase-like lactoylglutathione lyase family enzyme